MYTYKNFIEDYWNSLKEMSPYDYSIKNKISNNSTLLEKDIKISGYTIFKDEFRKSN